MKLDVPLIGILRGVEASFFKELMAVSFSAGLQAIEITMNTAGAVDIVAASRADVPEGKFLGMGTIRVTGAVPIGTIGQISGINNKRWIDHFLGLGQKPRQMFTSRITLGADVRI